MKLNITTLLLLLVLTVSCSQKDKVSEHCLRTRAVFDIGSGASRMQVAKVNVCNNKILTTLLEQRESILYKEDLAKGKNKKLSSAIQQQGLQSLKQMKTAAEKYKPDGYVGTATAAFRESLNAKDYIQKINTELGLNVRIITAKEEAIVGFYSALTQVQQSRENVTVWDIGGSSQQIIFFTDNSNYEIYEGDLGSVDFKNVVLKDVVKRKTFSPNPLNEEQITKTIKLAENYAIQNTPKRIKSEFKNNKRKVIGIGGVHFFSVLKQFNKSKVNSITQTELFEGIKTLNGKTDADYGNQKYAETMVTNPIMVYGFMKALDIKELEIYNLDLTQGLLIHPDFWN